ncbi:MAG: hypothetical protein P1S60_15245, partial [Anaerolineae bacterium]|nr:hypothetical protein [Anaerolineae bacterium]
MKKRIVAIALLALMVLMTGCSDEDYQILIDIAMSWAAEHAVEIAAYGVFGATGNTEVDAVLDARGVINN